MELKPSNRPESNEVPEYWTKPLSLHYPELWHNHQTGGGCMVVTSDNISINGKQVYIGITSECVTVNIDDFNDDNWLQIEQMIEDALWSFDDHAAKLARLLLDHCNTQQYDVALLMVDIMEIGTSGVC